MRLCCDFHYPINYMTIGKAIGWTKRIYDALQTVHLRNTLHAYDA